MAVLLENYLTPDMGGDYAKALAAAVRAAGADPVTMTSGRTYPFATTFVADSDFRLDMNNATILAPRSGAVIGTTQDRVTLTKGPYFTAKKGSRSFPVPRGLSLAPGDFVQLESNSIREPNGNYRHGEWVDIAQVRGGTAVMVRPFMHSFPVDRIRVRKHGRQEIFGGTIDLSPTRPIRGGRTGPFGVTLLAREVFARLRVIGSPHTAIGVHAQGYNVDIGGEADGILNRHGNNDGKASARLGYGFAGAGRFVWFFGEARDCKHGFTSASRDAFAEHVLFDNCSGSTPAGASAAKDDGGRVPLYQGIVDVHANVARTTVRGARLQGCNTLMMLRNPEVVIENAELTGFDCDNGFGQRGLIYLGENAQQKVTARTVRAASSPRHRGTATPSIFFWHSVFGNQNLDLDAQDISGSDNRLFQMQTSKGRGPSIGIGNLRFASVRGNFTGGAIIGGDDPAETIGRIGSVSLDGAGMTLDGQGYERAPLLCVQNFRAVDRVATSGRMDASALSNRHSAIQIGRDMNMRVGRGAIGDIAAKADLRAYRTAYDIASTSNVRPGVLDFSQSVIRYNAARAGPGVDGVKTQLATRPASLSLGGASLVNLGQ